MIAENTPQNPKPILRSLAEQYLRMCETVTNYEQSELVDAEMRHTARTYGYSLGDVQDEADMVYADEIISGKR